MFRCNLTTLASYLPSYDDIKTTIINNFLQPTDVKTLLFKDWPQDEIHLDSVDDFVSKMYDLGLTISRTIFGDGPCGDDND